MYHTTNVLQDERASGWMFCHKHNPSILIHPNIFIHSVAARNCRAARLTTKTEGQGRKRGGAWRRKGSWPGEGRRMPRDAPQIPSIHHQSIIDFFSKSIPTPHGDPGIQAIQYSPLLHFLTPSSSSSDSSGSFCCGRFAVVGTYSIGSQWAHMTPTPPALLNPWPLTVHRFQPRSSRKWRGRKSSGGRRLHWLTHGGGLVYQVQSDIMKSEFPRGNKEKIRLEGE